MPFPPFLGNCMPAWWVPHPAFYPFPYGESPGSNDFSSDSSLLDSQDSNSDSFSSIQSSPPALRALASEPSNNLIVSQTTVDIHLPPGPTVESFPLSLHPSHQARASSTPPEFYGQIYSPFQACIISIPNKSKDLHVHSDSADSHHHDKCIRRWVLRGSSPRPHVALPSSPVVSGEGTESDASFAPLVRRLRQARTTLPSSNQILRGFQASRPRFLAFSSIRSFSARSPVLPILQGSDNSSAGDHVSSRPTRFINPRQSLPPSSVRFRVPDRRARRSMSSLPSRLETLTAHYIKRGFSQIALQIYKNGNTDSTHRAYESAWALFREYLSFNRIHASRIRSSDIFNFLAYHRRFKNRKYRTLAKYRAAIKMPIKKHLKIDLDSDFSYQFMRGLRREVPPVRSAPMPRWSLDHLLSFLSSRRFEPLEQADFDYVVFKVIALLVLASGRRISCLSNLSRVSMKGKGGRVLLFWHLSYRPKNFIQLENNRSRLGIFGLISPSIRQLDPQDPSHPLCPVRVYKHLLERTSGAGFSSKFLWDHGHSKDRINIPKLSRSFIKAVEYAQAYANVPKAQSIGPHQERKLAASYRFMRCETLRDEEFLMQEMGFSSLQVMRRVYINPVPPLTHKCVVPGGTYIPGITRTVPYRPYRHSVPL